MGKRTPRKYSKISNEEFRQYLDDPKNIRVIELLKLKYYSIDRDIFESFKNEGLWLAISNHSPDKSNFQTYLSLTIEWLINQNLSAFSKKINGHRTICFSQLSDPLNDLQNADFNHPKNENTDLSFNCCKESLVQGLREHGIKDRDIDIFFSYHNGYKSKELAEQHNCSLKNISRIVTLCRNVLENNATRTELSL
jgi:hypothetical protein